jgi:hypothetical protein
MSGNSGILGLKEEAGSKTRHYNAKKPPSDASAQGMEMLQRGETRTRQRPNGIGFVRPVAQAVVVANAEAARNCTSGQAKILRTIAETKMHMQK